MTSYTFITNEERKQIVVDQLAQHKTFEEAATAAGTSRQYLHKVLRIGEDLKNDFYCKDYPWDIKRAYIVFYYMVMIARDITSTKDLLSIAGNDHQDIDLRIMAVEKLLKQLKGIKRFYYD